MDKPFSAYQGDEAYVFVSYAHKDTALVYPELVHLNEEGINAWYDEGISPGSSWSNELAEAILGANVLVFFGTPNAADSKHCIAEISFALDHDIPVLAAYLAETSMPVGMKLRLNTQQAIFRQGDNDARFRKALLDGVSNLANPASREHRVLAAPSVVRTRKAWFIPVVLAFALVAGVAVMLSKDAWWPGPGNVGPAVDQVERQAFEQNNFVITHQTIAIEPFSAAAEPDVIVARDVQRQMTVKLNEDSSVSVMLIRPGEIQTTQANYFLQGDVTTVGDITTLTLLLVNGHTQTIEFSESYAVGENFDSKAFAARTANTVVRFFFAEDNFREEYLEGEDPEALRLLSQTSHDDSGMMDEQRWKAIARLAKTDQLHDYAHLKLANSILDRMERHETDSEVAHAYLAEVRNKQSTMYLMRLAQLLLYVDLNYAKAEKTVLQGIETAPTDHSWYHIMAFIAAIEGRNIDALRWMNTALGADLYGDKHFVLWSVGQVHRVDGNVDEAISYYDQASALVEGSGDPYKILLLAHAGRASEAESLMERLLGIDLSDPLDASLPVGLPVVFIAPLIEIGQLARGQELLQRALAQQESSNDVDLYFVTEGYFALGDMDRGFEFLERAIKARSWYAALNLRSREWKEELGHDPRFEDMLVLLESMETHTDKYRSVVHVSS